MADALLVFAVLCACLSVREGGRLNVAALALLASVATTSAFVWFAVPFIWWLWGAIDLAVIGAILSGEMTTAKWAILPLFIPAWISYAEPDAFAHTFTTILVSIQLLLTVRPKQIIAAPGLFVTRWKANFQHRNEWTDLERRGLRGTNG